MLLQILFFSVTLAAAQNIPQPDRTQIKDMYDMGNCDAGGTITVCGTWTSWDGAACVLSGTDNIQPNRTLIKDMYNVGDCDTIGTITLCGNWTSWYDTKCALSTEIKALLSPDLTMDMILTLTEELISQLVTEAAEQMTEAAAAAAAGNVQYADLMTPAGVEVAGTEVAVSVETVETVETVDTALVDTAAAAAELDAVAEFAGSSTVAGLVDLSAELAQITGVVNGTLSVNGTN